MHGEKVVLQHAMQPAVLSGWVALLRRLSDGHSVDPSAMRQTGRETQRIPQGVYFRVWHGFPSAPKWCPTIVEGDDDVVVVVAVVAFFFLSPHTPPSLSLSLSLLLFFFFLFFEMKCNILPIICGLYFFCKHKKHHIPHTHTHHTHARARPQQQQKKCQK